MTYIGTPSIYGEVSIGKPYVWIKEKNKMSKILFTGERGQLAQKISESLALKGGVVVHSQESLRSVCSHHHPYPELDVTDIAALRLAVEVAQPDVIVHLAAITGTDKCDTAPKKCVDVNLMGTHNVLEVCREFGIKLVYFSTTATYDPSADNPRPFTELSKQRPPTLYGITKYAGELLVTGQSAVPWMVVRPCFVFGDAPLDHSSQLCKIAVHSFLKFSWSEKAGPTPDVLLDPFALKDYMRIEDFAEVASVLIGDPFWGQTFNVSQGESRPVGAYFAALEKALGFELDMTWDPGADYMGDHVVSSERLLACVDWKPKIDFKEGTRLLAESTIKYVRDCQEGRSLLLYK